MIGMILRLTLDALAVIILAPVILIGRFMEFVEYEREWRNAEKKQPKSEAERVAEFEREFTGEP